MIDSLMATTKYGAIADALRARIVDGSSQSRV